MRREAIRLSKEVSEALAEGRAVVALESSVIAQGLPPPKNLENARACEKAIRDAGAVPATTAVIDGQLCAGLTNDELEQLARPEVNPLKVGERDFAVAVALKRWGGTTVSGTCAIADAVGIRLFATGGIGGVHRDAENTFDVSQDLGAIARSRVAVVTAGAKAILDLPKTLEVLETLGVPVLGYRVSELPAFYTSKSGLALEHRAESPDDVARILQARFDFLNQGGVIVANRIPVQAEADPLNVQAAVEQSLKEAKEKGVGGKALTPFLLARVSQLTGGESMKANLALLASNARLAGEIAVALSRGTVRKDG